MKTSSEPPEMTNDSTTTQAKRAKKPYEDRPGWATCFPPKNPKSDKSPHFVGVTSIDGTKYWISIWKKLDRHGERFLSVSVTPQDDKR
jgi:hypothetical protein